MARNVYLRVRAEILGQDVHACMQQVSSMNLAHVAVGHTVQIWILVGPFGKIWQGTPNRIMGKADRRCTARSTFSAEFEQRKDPNWPLVS